MSSGEFLFRDSCGQKFTYTHHGHGYHGNLGLLMIALNWVFF